MIDTAKGAHNPTGLARTRCVTEARAGQRISLSPSGFPWQQPLASESGDAERRLWRRPIVHQLNVRLARRHCVDSRQASDTGRCIERGGELH